MNLLDHHLHRLFLDHDCVVVPGLGGFVCNRKPAKYDENRQELIPPSRSILFNERIVHHDGVLVQAIARKSSISLDEALVRVEEEAAVLKAQMQGGNTVRIHQVGRLFLGEEGHLRFMPDEEMERILRSFGLKRIPLPLLNPKMGLTSPSPAARIIAMPTADQKQIQAPWRRIAAAIAVPILGGAGMFFADSMGNDVALMSTIPVSLQSHEEAVYQPRFEEEKVPAWETIEATIPETIEVDNVRSTSADEVTKTNGMTALELPDLSENKVIFMLVAGSFSVESNAMNLSADLIRKGFDSEVYLQESGLHLVTFSAHADEQNARIQLAELREEKSTERAWLKRFGAAH
jgi:hypothetical protein